MRTERIQGRAVRVIGKVFRLIGTVFGVMWSVVGVIGRGAKVIMPCRVSASGQGSRARTTAGCFVYTWDVLVI